MADEDPNPALRAELDAALAVLEPQIRGLGYYSSISSDEDLKRELDEQKRVRMRRRDKIQAVLEDLDNVVEGIQSLKADGYPNFPPVNIDPRLFTELQNEDSDLDAAVKLFSPAHATNVSFTLGEPTPKANP